MRAVMAIVRYKLRKGFPVVADFLGQIRAFPVFPDFLATAANR